MSDDAAGRLCMHGRYAVTTMVTSARWSSESYSASTDHAIFSMRLVMFMPNHASNRVGSGTQSSCPTHTCGSKSSRALLDF